MPRKAETPRVGKLHNLAHVRAELAKVYRDARRGEISIQDGARLASILSILRQVIEVGDVERRLDELEQSMKL